MARRNSSKWTALPPVAQRGQLALRGATGAASVGWAVGLAVLFSWAGCCSMGPDYAAPTACPPGTVPVATPETPVVVNYPNPVFIPIADSQCAWETVVDVVDDYFKIEHEEPVRQVGNTTIEGNLVTLPQISPTIFEPWRHDTGDREQRWENTLQTMRRRANVRVMPAQGGYLVDVQVYKELEDNRHPDHATAGEATFRYDDTLTGVINPVGEAPTTLGWIAKGRDTSLEQSMLANLLSRCTPVSGTPGPQPVVMRGQDR